MSINVFATMYIYLRNKLPTYRGEHTRAVIVVWIQLLSCYSQRPQAGAYISLTSNVITPSMHHHQIIFPISFCACVKLLWTFLLAFLCVYSINSIIYFPLYVHTHIYICVNGGASTEILLLWPCGPMSVFIPKIQSNIYIYIYALLL